MTRRRLNRVLLILSGILIGLLVGLLAFMLYFDSLSHRLPDLKNNPDALKGAETSVVYAGDGTVLAEWYDSEDRTVIDESDIPAVMKNATVAIEDRRFYEHTGVDPQAVLRAFAVNSEAGEVRQGGSTITQQVVKMLFTGGERTIGRKIEEALLALSLETQVDKDEVLGVYLNTVYFGRGAYGVESAAERFFGADAAQLTLTQAALLAGCIQSPTRYDPLANPVAALERRNVVLRQMRNEGYISSEQFSQASAEPLGLTQPEEKKQFAPYFVEYVRRDLLERLGSERLYRGGLRVYTTLDPEAQRAAEAAAKRALPNKKDPEVALAAVRYKDGAVVALVGGRDFSAEQFDLATQGRRQTGSAFKPFVLAAALEEGYSLESRFDASAFSTPVRDGVWDVENYENYIRGGSYTLREATIRSINTVYARLIMRVGAEKVVEVANAMGIETPIDPEPAIALGGLNRGVSPLEMASAFGTFANEGMAVKPSGVVRVTDQDGRLIYEPDREGTRAIKQRTATDVTNALNGTYRRGTGMAANFGKWGAVKTGTAQNWQDAWIVGYSGELSTAVWVGYPKKQVPMINVHGKYVTGGSFPADVWRDFMAAASAPKPKRAVAESAELDSATHAGYSVYKVCADSLMMARSDCPNQMELELKSGSIPDEICDHDH